MTERTTCNQPDRDAPGLRCGYPLPCPWHTAVIDLTVDDRTAERLIEIERALRR